MPTEEEAYTNDLAGYRRILVFQDKNLKNYTKFQNRAYVSKLNNYFLNIRLKMMLTRQKENNLQEYMTLDLH